MNVSVGGGGGGAPPLLRGSGVPAWKSALLLSVSGALSVRLSAVVLLRPGAAAVSKSLAVPYPMKSLTPAAVAHVAPQLSAALPVTRATLPFVPLMLMEPVASGAGRAVVPPVPAAS